MSERRARQAEPTTKPVTERMSRLAEQKRAALEKARNADLKLRKLRAEQDRMSRISARKEHNRALIQAGILAEIAGVLRLDRGTLLGGLIYLAKSVDGKSKKARQWKQSGDAEIARREVGKTSPNPP